MKKPTVILKLQEDDARWLQFFLAAQGPRPIIDVDTAPLRIFHEIGCALGECACGGKK
jgi:hypothetical protein